MGCKSWKERERERADVGRRDGRLTMNEKGERNGEGMRCETRKRNKQTRLEGAKCRSKTVR